MKWIVVSYFTQGTSYEKEIRLLLASLARFKLPHKVYSYPPTGTWRGNLNFKSEAVLRAMDEFPDQDIVFLDADAVVRQHPRLFDQLSQERKYDMAAHFYHYRPESGDADELLSGTLWFQNGKKGRLLAERWHAIGLAEPLKRHQMCLKLAVAALRAEGFGPHVFRLPFEYTRIFDYRLQGRTGPPVIEHFQASRRFRREVGYGVKLVPGKPPARPVIRIQGLNRKLAWVAVRPDTQSVRRPG